MPACTGMMEKIQHERLWWDVIPAKAGIQKKVRVSKTLAQNLLLQLPETGTI